MINHCEEGLLEMEDRHIAEKERKMWCGSEEKLTKILIVVVSVVFFEWYVRRLILMEILITFGKE